MLSENDIQVHYPWLSTEFFTRIVKKVFPENVIRVQKYTVKSALGAGENFTSQMLRATVQYSSDDLDGTQEIRFIIKAAVSDVKNREFLEEMDLFEKETANFQYILPEVYKLLESVGDCARMSAT